MMLFHQRLRYCSKNWYQCFRYIKCQQASIDPAYATLVGVSEKLQAAEASPNIDMLMRWASMVIYCSSKLNQDDVTALWMLNTGMPLLWQYPRYQWKKTIVLFNHNNI